MLLLQINNIFQKKNQVEKMIQNLKSFFNVGDKNGIMKYFKGTRIKNTERYTMFISWLKKNDKRLIKEIKEDFKKRKIDLATNDSKFAISVIGFWLGGRYIADLMRKYGFEKHVTNFPPIKYDINNLAYDIKRNCFNISEGPELMKLNNLECYINGFNKGIHEYTHAMPAIFLNDQPGRPSALTELASSLNETTYGLPIFLKKNRLEYFDNNNNINGTICPYNIYEQMKTYHIKVNENSGLFGLYIVSFIVPFIKTYYKKKGITVNPFDFVFGKETPFMNYFFSFRIKTSNHPLNETEMGMYRKEAKEYASYICDLEGITDTQLRAKIEGVFEKLFLSSYKNSYDFFKEFIEQMKNAFGEPDFEKFPPGFVFYYNKSLKNFNGQNGFFFSSNSSKLSKNGRYT